jgi:hypothetical protein
MSIFEHVDEQEERVVRYVNQSEGDGSTPLFMAVYDGNPDLVSYLLAHGADAHFSCHHGNFLHAAILSQHLPLFERGLALGCDVNEINVFGNSPLTLVSRWVPIIKVKVKSKPLYSSQKSIFIGRRDDDIDNDMDHDACCGDDGLGGGGDR